MNPKPRAFEPRRLLQAARAHLTVLLGVSLLSLFGGALVGRLAVPNQQVAQAAARIVREPHVIFGRALEDDVLERALRKASEALPVSTLRARTRLGFEGRDRLRVEVSGTEDEGPESRRLADALVETYVALANERLDQDTFELRRQREGALSQARAERERADAALSAALAREGLPELARELSQTRSQLSALEGEASAARVEANAARERASALHEPALHAPKTRETASANPGKSSPESLASAQRELSRKLAEGAPAAELASLRTHIQKLQQTPEAAPDTSLRAREADARALAVRARGLEQRVAQKQAELARLEAAGTRAAPLLARADQTRAHQLELESQTDQVRSAQPRSSVAQHAELSDVPQYGLRVLISLLSPVVALLALGLFYLLHQLPNLRVREATELAHWLAAPVLTSSAWPGNSVALEALVDELADPALAALGTTLLLPLTELERPLAATLVAQLNMRAQRHYRSLTGSRVTIAQDWQGELDSSRIQRAAEAADRVLWVVAADVHHGRELAARRPLVARSRRVAALLVDAEPDAIRAVGDAAAFWRTNASALEAAALPARP